MDEGFKVFLEQLRDGKTKKISEVFAPEFLGIQDPELILDSKVFVNGEAYIAEEEVLVHLQVKTKAKLPCAICNEWVEKEIHLEDLYLAEPLTNIRGGIYNFKQALREEILLEIPLFVECHQGNCPERKEYERFFKTGQTNEEDEGGYKPFSDL